MPTISQLLCFTALSITLSCTNTEYNDQQTPAEIPPKVFRDSVYIHHQSYGIGDTALLFIHGWCINQTYWSEQIPIVAKNYRVVTIDLPGFGQSGDNRSDWSMEAYGQDVQAVIEQLDLQQVILVGHSMGGDIMLEAALRTDAVIALIGIDNFKDVAEDISPAVQAEIEDFLNLLRADFSPMAVTYADAVLFHNSTDSVSRERVLQSFATAKPASALAAIEGLIAYTTKEPSQLAKLQQPLYLINSNATPTDTSILNSIGMHYQLIDIDSTGHYPMIEKPEVFNALLMEVLERIKE